MDVRQVGRAGRTDRGTGLRRASGVLVAGALVLATTALTALTATSAAAAAQVPAAAARPAAAAFTPTLSVSPTSGGPGSTIRLKGTGFKPTDTIFIYVGSAYMCAETPSASGVLAAVACTVPATVHGAATLSAQQDSNTIVANTTFTVTSRITYINDAVVSPGAVITVNASGFAASSALGAKVDSTTAVTNPPAISSDASGSVGNLQITIPAGTTVGTHTLTIRDSAGNQATKTITVFAPSIVATPATTQPGAPLTVTGSGWKPGGTVYIYANTSYFCNATASSTGTINASCTAPSIPDGSYVLNGQESGTLVTATQAGASTPGFTYISSDDVSRGVSVSVNLGGFAASSALTATISGYTGNLVTNPVSVSSDTNGTYNGLTITLPTSTSLAAGSHTLTVTDGSGHAATTPVTVYVPTLTVSPTSGSPGKSVALTGTKWRPGDEVYFYLGTGYFGGVAADSTGSFAVALTLPAAPVGASVIYGYQESGNTISASKAFTIKPGVSYQSTQFISPGSSLTVNLGGLDPSVGFSTTVGKTAVTTTGPTTTDTNGSISSLVIPIPAAAKAGSTTITVKDKASKAQSVKITVQIYAPTLTITPSSGVPGAVLRVTGSGWHPDDVVYLYLNSTSTTYSTYYCQVRADDNGALNGTCTVPAVPAGSYTEVGQQDSNYVTAHNAATFTVVPGVTILSSDTVSATGSLQIYVQGLGVSSAVHVAVDTTAVTVTAGTPTTDTNGSVGYLTVALPATLAAGSHALTVTDALGNVAHATLTAITPSITLSDTTIAAGTAFAINGSGFDSGSVAIYLDGTYFCGQGADASGDLTGSCTIPAGTATGNHTLSVQQDSDAVQVSQTITTS